MHSRTDQFEPRIAEDDQEDDQISFTERDVQDNDSCSEDDTDRLEASLLRSEVSLLRPEVSELPIGKTRRVNDRATESVRDEATFDHSRTASGQTELRHEDFSPVFISKHNTTDGQIDYVALSKSQIADRLRQLNLQNSDFEHSTVSDSRQSESLANETLPEDLPVGTPDVLNVGEFVSVKRGGYSADGSFRRRPLSPSPLKSVTDLNDESSTQQRVELSRPSQKSTDSTAAVLPAAPSPPPVPTTPAKSGPSQFLSPEKTRSSASPLKLFGDHDTFTSTRLHRRLSQLEDLVPDELQAERKSISTRSPRRRNADPRLSSLEEASFQDIASPKVTTAAAKQSSKRQFSTGSNFGQGELDEYPFPEDLSFASSNSDDASGLDISRSPSPNAAPPGSQAQFKFRLGSSPEIHNTFKHKGKLSERSRESSITVTKRSSVKSSKTKLAGRPLAPNDPASVSQGVVTGNAKSKRPPTSPYKNPTPKRRRTLCTVEIEEHEDFVVESVKESHTAIQSIVSTQPNDRRQESYGNSADPSTLARQHILRPRNPTPSQRRRDQIQAEILEATDAFLSSSPRLQAIQEHLSSPAAPGTAAEALQAKAIAGEVAAFTVRVAQGMKDEGRKRSVTTQDFLDEARSIMEYFRSKGRPISALSSLEESESEHPDAGDDAPINTSLTFSRPPSREGRRSGWRSEAPQGLDPRVMSHLRRFEENDDENFIASMRSLHLSPAKEPDAVERPLPMSEPSNIRISQNRPLDSGRGRSESDATQPGTGSTGTTAKTHTSHTSVDSSLGRTINTSVSRRSGTVATLGPELVVPLIGDQVADMRFDKELGKWVRTKSPKKGKKAPGDISHVTESEEDPFGNIPDLTVDEFNELARSGPATAPSFGGQDIKAPHTIDDATVHGTSHAQSTGAQVPSSRPTTRGTTEPTLGDASTVPSRFSHFGSSGPQIETRATSWSEQGTMNKATGNIQTQSVESFEPQGASEEIEHEIQIDEGRTDKPVNKLLPKVRNVTISFSSPVVPRVHRLVTEERVLQRENSVLSAPDDLEPQKSARIEQLASQHSISNAHPFETSSSGLYRGASRQVSQYSRVPRTLAVPRHHENSELSATTPSPEKPRMQLAVSVSGTFAVEGKHGSAIQQAHPPAHDHAEFSFLLSDLPEFTVNQIDERELPVRTLVRRQGNSVTKAAEDRYEQGTQELVKALQDAYADEPYWEDVRKLDLHDRALPTLHRLDEFCYRVEELDVSGNCLTHLNGAPCTVRKLIAQRNALTGLTSWGHLMHLQYLDVSGNDIDTLEGFGGLIHLRELKANDNRLTSLEGVLHLDGLMSLSVSRNKLQEVDFKETNFMSLIDLNMSGNELSALRNLQCLPRLTSLNLDQNSFDEFTASTLQTQPCQSLRSLRLQSNDLRFVDLSSSCPNLERLHLDQNQLTPQTLIGLETLHRLRTLSARDQRVGSSLSSLTIRHCFMDNHDITSLLISANHIPRFEMSHHFLNLQHLELASCGLQALPEKFGQLAPNVRVLNLNFNALKDLRPLLGIKRLSQLSLAGNRLARLRKNLAVLSQLKTLTALDLRENPFAVGFYLPATENRVATRSMSSEEAEEDRDTHVLPMGDVERDRQYLARLDEDTKLRRRVYEMLLANSCRDLRTLDGMEFARQRVVVKDEIWDRLLSLRILKKSGRDSELGLEGESL
ncbi:Protein nud1 [Coniosporium tulheliwenetii]|uniref:Protein nud1 n=1 Tax=Coniosporium tulheliwenetii TaxID=3383036 RepID=A0ACC2ZKA1_9PEZI|nr:Protein nud1 [Cladosporium sp. JES 115]